MAEWVDSKSPEEVWRTVQEIWFRIFGPPEVLVRDPGREFFGEFQENAMAEGIVVYQTAAKAPWQQGKQRSMEGTSSRCWRARAEVVVTNRTDLKALMVEVRTDTAIGLDSPRYKGR